MIAPTAGVKAVMNSTCHSPTSPAVFQGFYFCCCEAPFLRRRQWQKRQLAVDARGLRQRASVNVDLYVKADGTGALARASWLSVVRASMCLCEIESVWGRAEWETSILFGHTADSHSPYSQTVTSARFCQTSAVHTTLLRLH